MRSSRPAPPPQRGGESHGKGRAFRTAAFVPRPAAAGRLNPPQPRQAARAARPIPDGVSPEMVRTIT
ncbi:MAG: hypothetical protein U1E05_07490, partial [Patescibacteria group bacterium]|nr:hypothetical protein [Patescibacteria group bacterium]